MISDAVVSDLGSDPPLHSPADDMAGDAMPQDLRQVWAMVPLTS